jgi:uroporphyrinogen decarboxylase
MEELTPRQRMLIAIANGEPDRVPVAPDISNMVPCRLTGKPFWKIYRDEDPPLWRAYLHALDYFKFDGWFTYGQLELKQDWQVTARRRVVRRTATRLVERSVHRTPAGELSSERTYYIADPPTPTEKIVKDIVADLPKLRYFYPEPTGCDDAVLREQRRELGEKGVLGIGVGCPGFHSYVDLFHGGLEAVTYAYYDHPEEMEELRLLQHHYFLKRAEMAIGTRPDFILTGGSGGITLQSPELFRRLTLPTLKAICEMAAQAGVLTMVHCCGKERALVEMAAKETRLNCVNPLEEAPMGDCDLAEVKRTFGHRLSLMGNLHTTKVMLHGRPETVERAARKAIDAAGAGGGFILSTGDQCGRDTPDENIFRLVDVARTYGRYT